MFCIYGFSRSIIVAYPFPFLLVIAAVTDVRIFPHGVADVLTVRSLKFKFFVKSTDSNMLKRNRDGSVSINEY